MPEKRSGPKDKVRRRPAGQKARTGQDGGRSRDDRPRGVGDKRSRGAGDKRSRGAGDKRDRSGKGRPQSDRRQQNRQTDDGRYSRSGKTWRSDKARKNEGAAQAVDQDQILDQAARATVGPAGYRKFSDIPAHKLGRKLRGDLYSLTRQLPAEEENNLTARIKKAATSITAALVTGFGVGTFRSGVEGALESRGALMALQDHLQQAAQLEFIAQDEQESMSVKLDELIASVNEYLGELVRQRDSGK